MSLYYAYMSPSQSRLVVISTGSIVRVLALLAAIGVAWMIRDILLIVFVAMLLAGVVYPFARWAEARRIPKGIAVFVFYILLFGAIVLILSLLVPRVIEQMRAFVSTYHGVGWLLGERATWEELLQRLGLAGDLPGALSGLRGQAERVLTTLLSTASNVFGSIVTFFAVLVLSFYMIIEDRAVKTLFHNLIPTEYRDLAAKLVSEMLNKLGGWMRGQLILGFIIGILYFIVFWVLGVPYALLLALLGGLLEFIPYIGPFIAAIPAVLLGLSVSPTLALGALVATLVVQRIENDIIVPKVMQQAVGLNPIVSLIAFMVGAKLFGFIGAIFAIPVATAVSVVLSEIFAFQKTRKT